MQFKDGRLLLSPSDVTAYLGCEHLTTLSLQVARGELAKPVVETLQRTVNQVYAIARLLSRAAETLYLGGSARASVRSISAI